MRVRLAGKADQKSRAKGQIWQGVAHFAEKPLVLLDAAAALHGFEHRVVAMLQGHVNIGNDLGQFAHDVEQRLPNHRRIAVEQAKPLNACNGSQRAQQVPAARDARTNPCRKPSCPARPDSVPLPRRRPAGSLPAPAAQWAWSGACPGCREWRRRYRHGRSLRKSSDRPSRACRSRADGIGG